MARIVFIGDDFTGASDTLATLAERGARVRLFLGEPDETEVEGLDAVGIATDLRRRRPDEIAARLAALAPLIARLSPRFVHYKVCSTFDSAVHVGSIGAAVGALEAALAPARTIVLGGQPSLGRYCLFANLFARAPDGETYRIDRHPIMSRHPVTPMDEADLRLHLARQGLAGLAPVTCRQLQSCDGPIAALGAGAARILVDAVEQRDVDRLGELLRGADHAAPLLVVGASGVAEALVPGGRGGSPAARGGDRRSGPLLAIAGSRSSATAAQIAAATGYERLAVGRENLARDDPVRDGELVDRCVALLEAGRNVLVHLRPGLDYGRSPAALSDFLAGLARAVLDRHRAAGVAVAGGDTAGAVVERLGFESLSFIGRMGGGVALCRGHAAGRAIDGTMLLLKGGQVGDIDLFDRFAARVR